MLFGESDFGINTITAGESTSWTFIFWLEVRIFDPWGRFGLFWLMDVLHCFRDWS